MGSGLLEEIQDDFEKVNNIKDDINSLQVFLPRIRWRAFLFIGNNIIITIFITIFILVYVACIVKLRENHNERYYKHIVNRQDSYQKVPSLAESTFSVDQIPSYLDWLVFTAVPSFIVFVIVDVVDHHFFQI